MLRIRKIENCPSAFFIKLEKNKNKKNQIVRWHPNYMQQISKFPLAVPEKNSRQMEKQTNEQPDGGYFIGFSLRDS